MVEYLLRLPFYAYELFTVFHLKPGLLGFANISKNVQFSSLELSVMSLRLLLVKIALVYITEPPFRCVVSCLRDNYG